MAKKSEDIFIRFDRIHERDKHRNRQADTAWQHRLRGNIALCGNKM